MSIQETRALCEFRLEGINLRRPRPEDAEAIFEYGSDHKVARFADWPMQTDIEPIVERIHERAIRAVLPAFL